MMKADQEPKKQKMRRVRWNKFKNLRKGQFKSCTWGGISCAPVQVEANGLERCFVEKTWGGQVATKLNTSQQ